MPRNDDPRGAPGHGHRVEGRVIQVILFLVIVFGFRAIRVTLVEVISVADAFITGVTSLTWVFEAAELAVRDINVIVVTIVGVVECGFFNGQQACFGQLFEGGVNDLGGEDLVAAVPTGCGCQCQVSCPVQHPPGSADVRQQRQHVEQPGAQPRVVTRQQFVERLRDRHPVRLAIVTIISVAGHAAPPSVSSLRSPSLLHRRVKLSPATCRAGNYESLSG